MSKSWVWYMVLSNSENRIVRVAHDGQRTETAEYLLEVLEREGEGFNVERLRLTAAEVHALRS